MHAACLDGKTWREVVTKRYHQLYSSCCVRLGTPPAYYFVAGTGDGSTKWYIHHSVKPVQLKRAWAVFVFMAVLT
jgi:hypothetical protein